MLSGVKNNLKMRKVTIIQVAMALILFLMINDKGLFGNLFKDIHSLTNINGLTFESVTSNMINIGRIISLEYSLSMSIGYFVVQVAVSIIAISCFFTTIKFQTYQEVKVENEYGRNVVCNTFDTQDIYLKTNKLIC